MSNTTTPLERVLSACDNAGRKRKGDGSGGYLVSCPGPNHAHGDRNPSLHVSEGASGKVLLQCFAGCDTPSILDALALPPASLFDDNGTEWKPDNSRSLRPFTPTASTSTPAKAEKAPAKLAEQAAPVPVAKTVPTEYLYTDAEGNPVGKVERLDQFDAEGTRLGKSFRQYRHDGNGYRLGLGEGTSRTLLPLYRLPEVVEALGANRRVFLCEGEKDAENLRALGEVATTNAGGSNGWRDRLAEDLTGAAHVVVVVDRDEPGRKWARSVVASLTARGITHSTWQAGNGLHDVSDHLGAGLDLDDVEPLDLDAPGQATPGDVQEEALPATTWEPVNLASVFAGNQKEEAPGLLHRTDGKALLYAGRTHSIHGESASGKSWVALVEAARLLTSGESVLFLDFEDKASGVVGRLRALGVTEDAMLRRFVYVRPHEGLKTHESREALDDILSRTYALAVVDGVTEALALDGVNPNSDTEFVAWAARLPRRIARETGAAVVVVDHVVKDREGRGRHARGTGAKLDNVDGAAYLVEMVEAMGKGRRGVISLRLAKDRHGGVSGFLGDFRKSDRTQDAARIVFDATDPEHLSVSVEPPDTEDKGSDGWRPTALMERASIALEGMPSGSTMTQAQLATAMGGKKATCVLAITHLVAEGYATEEPGPRGAKLLRSVRAYRQGEDPKSDKVTPVPRPLTLDED